MKRTVLRTLVAVGAVATVVVFVHAGTLMAKNDDDDDGNKGGEKRPPQTLQQGF